MRGDSTSENPRIKVADLEVKRMVTPAAKPRAASTPPSTSRGHNQRAIELQTVSMNMGGQSQHIKMGTDNGMDLRFSAAKPLVERSLWKAIQISDTTDHGLS